MSISNEALLGRWFNEIWNERKPDTIDELFAEDGIGHLEAVDIVGPGPFHEYFQEMTTVFPKLRITIDEIISQGESAAIRWTVDATHGGEGFGLKPTHREVEFHGMTWVHIRGGKIVEGWDSWNRDGLIQQLKSFGGDGHQAA
jgi:predicted ester cyclase